MVEIVAVPPVVAPLPVRRWRADVSDQKSED
jgi:hypothetical protein